jgi:hypothetical protein
LTPAFSRLRRPIELLGFDVAEKEDRIQKTRFRMRKNSRRQNPAVGFGKATLKRQASKPGSWKMQDG